MNKTFVIIMFTILSITTLTAMPIDSLITYYKNGEFSSHCQEKIKTTSKTANEVSDYLVSDFHTNPGHLFKWALKDLGLQNSKNELIIVYKNSIHDKNTGITHGEFDIIVPGITTLKNIKVDAIVSKKTYTSGVIKVTANILQSTMLLNNAVGTLLIIPQKNNEFIIDTNVSIKFGWFFNLFITQKRYKSIVEWRIKKFSDNIIEECKSRD